MLFSLLAFLKLAKLISSKLFKIIFEINEAFSSQSIAVINDLSIDYEKVNIDGGAISIGHPLGASGARIVGKAASILHRTNSRKAIATMCIGGGMGISIALERY